MKSIAFVTGGNRGLGLALCEALSKQGYKVWMGCRNISSGMEIASRVSPNIAAVEMDVSRPDSVYQAMSNVAKVDSRLDLLINNAGIYPSGDDFPVSQTPSNLLNTLTVNVVGVHSTIQAAIPLLQKGIKPAIVNISSGFGSLTLNSQWNKTALSYCTSKAALNMLSLQWAHTLTPMGINICMPSPGWMQTSMGHPNGKTPEEGAAIILESANLCRQGLNKIYFGENGIIPW